MQQIFRREEYSRKKVINTILNAIPSTLHRCGELLWAVDNILCEFSSSGIFLGDVCSWESLSDLFMYEGFSSRFLCVTICFSLSFKSIIFKAFCCVCSISSFSNICFSNGDDRQSDGVCDLFASEANDKYVLGRGVCVAIVFVGIFSVIWPTVCVIITEIEKRGLFLYQDNQ